MFFLNKHRKFEYSLKKSTRWLLFFVFVLYLSNESKLSTVFRYYFREMKITNLNFFKKFTTSSK